MAALTESALGFAEPVVISVRKRHLVVVAETRSGIAGYAYVKPWLFPGLGTPDPNSALLHRVVVKPGNRLHGVGRMLVDAVVRLLTARHDQALILGHTSPSAVGFFRSIGWTVPGRGEGTAWQPTDSHLRADRSDNEDYPYTVSLVLQRKKLTFVFRYPGKTTHPIADALEFPRGAIAAGDIPEGAVHWKTMTLLTASDRMS